MVSIMTYTMYFTGHSAKIGTVGFKNYVCRIDTSAHVANVTTL